MMTIIRLIFGNYFHTALTKQVLSKYHARILIEYFKHNCVHRLNNILEHFHVISELTQLKHDRTVIVECCGIVFLQHPHKMWTKILRNLGEQVF